MCNDTCFKKRREESPKISWIPNIEYVEINPEHCDTCDKCYQMETHTHLFSYHRLSTTVCFYSISWAHQFTVRNEYYLWLFKRYWCLTAIYKHILCVAYPSNLFFSSRKTERKEEVRASDRETENKKKWMSNKRNKYIYLYNFECACKSASALNFV